MATNSGRDWPPLEAPAAYISPCSKWSGAFSFLALAWPGKVSSRSSDTRPGSPFHDGPRIGWHRSSEAAAQRRLGRACQGIRAGLWPPHRLANPKPAGTRCGRARAVSNTLMTRGGRQRSVPRQPKHGPYPAARDQSGLPTQGTGGFPSPGRRDPDSWVCVQGAARALV